MSILSKFTYRPSQKVRHWGCHFDSLTELKYTLSIRDDYAFLRAGVSIFYHPGTLLATETIRRCHRRYTPDFLVRHYQTHKAFLIEIKPRAFEHHPQLLVRRQVAENYIRWKKYDWQYKIVFDDEIILDEEEWEAFQQCCRLTSASARKLYLQEQNNKYGSSASPFSLQAPSSKQIEFVLFGKKGG